MTETQRTVTSAADRAAKPGTSQSRHRAHNGTRGTTKTTKSRAFQAAHAAKNPLYDLTQIHFMKGMMAGTESGKETDTVETRWSEFYGDIESGRAKVAGTTVSKKQARFRSLCHPTACF